MKDSLDMDWSKVKKETKDLTVPGVVKNAYNVNLFNHDHIAEVIRNLDGSSSNCRSHRVNIGGKFNEAATTNVVSNGPILGESLESWQQRIYPDQKLGIVINISHIYSKTLENRGNKWLGEYKAALGKSYATLDVAIFLGNYGYTPFGIHKDDGYTDIFHFHTFGKKTMWTWSEPEYNKMKLRVESFASREDMLASGTRFEIESGDLFFMPAHFYHIGYTPDPSGAISFGLSDRMWGEIPFLEGI
jgi:hypothetical protein